jgi:hypothetical protein
MNSDIYNLEILPGTRNHKGYFIQDRIYKLIAIDQAGWALICMDEMSCHYVDPEDLREIAVNEIS